MKIAGQKNTGAWFRFNKWITAQPTPVKTALQQKIVALDTCDAAFNALDALATEAGQGGIVASSGDWVDGMMAEGIPLQIWMGKLSWQSYTRSGSPGDYEYTANYASPIHYFAVDLRKTCAHYKASIREVSDVFNLLENNPGGLPNADKTS